MRSFEAARSLVHDRPLRRALVLAATLLVGVGFVAIGVSGFLNAGSRAAWGERFVAGHAPQIRYSRQLCARLLEYEPDAPSCSAAAAADHADEVVRMRILAGVLGAAVLGAWVLARRRNAGAALPPTLVPAVGVTAFGGASAALMLLGADALIRYGGDAGAGQWLSGGLVAGVVALWFAARLIVELTMGITH